MPRRLIPFAIIVLLAFVATTGSLLTNLIAGDHSLTAWLKNQHWYSLRNVLLALAVTVILTIVLEVWRSFASERPPENISPTLSADIANPLADRNDAAASGVRLPFAIPRVGAIEFIVRSGADGHDLLTRLKEEFAAPRNPLINLWGAGGVGKTALAAEVARQLAPTLNGRVVWTGPELRSGFCLAALLDEVASQVGCSDLRLVNEKSKKERLRAVLGDQRTLIVVDNFETIPEPEQSRCAEWLAKDVPCPALVTSRTALDSARNIQIGPMSPVEARAFIDKAIVQRANQHIFEAPLRERIIAMAEFNPLLMEWIVRQIDLARNPDRVLRDLARGASSATQRVFDRSFNLRRVGNSGRRTLMALSLFVPDSSTSAIAAVVGFGETLEERRIRGFLSYAHLQNRLRKGRNSSTKPTAEFVNYAWALSLCLFAFLIFLVNRKKGAESRAADKVDRTIRPLADLLLVKPVAKKRIVVEGLTRELARARLATRTESRVFRRRFVDHFAYYTSMYRADTPESYDELERERENILAAARIAFEDGDTQFTRQIFVWVSNFLSIRGYWDDFVRLGELALESARTESNSDEIVRCISGLASIRKKRGELEEARKLYEEYTALARTEVERSQADLMRRQQTAARRPPKKLSAINRLRVVQNFQGRVRRAAEAANLERQKQIDEARKRMASGLLNLGAIAIEQGDPDGAERLFQESMGISRELNDQNGLAQALRAFGSKASNLGDLDTAGRFYQESLEILRHDGTELEVADTLNSLGVLARRTGNFQKARSLHEESLEIRKKLGYQEGIAESLANLGGIDGDEGNRAEGIRLYGEALKIFDQLKSRKAEPIRIWLKENAHEQAIKTQP
jgi:tetratricopeptide (TPR) repeat protein